MPDTAGAQGAGRILRMDAVAGARKAAGSDPRLQCVAATGREGRPCRTHGLHLHRVQC